MSTLRRDHRVGGKASRRQLTEPFWHSVRAEGEHPYLYWMIVIEKLKPAQSHCWMAVAVNCKISELWAQDAKAGQKSRIDDAFPVISACKRGATVEAKVSIFTGFSKVPIRFQYIREESEPAHCGTMRHDLGRAKRGKGSSTAHSLLVCLAATRIAMERPSVMLGLSSYASAERPAPSA